MLNKSLELINRNRKCLFLSFLIIFASFFIERLIFNFNNFNNLKLCTYIILKIIFAVIIPSIIIQLNNFYKKISICDKLSRIQLKFTTVYFLSLMLLLLFTWPGNWMNDEFLAFQNCIDFQFNNSQSYITLGIYALSLMLLPFPAGILIIQSIIISIIVGYTCMITYKYSNGKFSYLMFMVYFLPPILFYDLFPLRACLYSYFTVYFIFKFFIICSTKGEIKRKNILLLCFFISILSIWRSEMIVFAILLPIYFIFFCNNISKINKLIAVFSIILFINILKIPAESYNNDPRYKVVPFINPLSLMLVEELASDDLEKDLNNINTVVNVDSMKKYSSYLDIPVWWTPNVNAVNLNYTKEEYNSFVKSYINLVLHNPYEFIKARSKTFLATSGFIKKSMPIYMPSASNKAIKTYFKDDQFKHGNLFTPINQDIRMSIYRSMYFLTNKDWPSNLYAVYLLFWNTMIPILALIAINIIALIKRDSKIFFISLIPIIQAVLMFLFQPAYHSMYHLPIYISGYVITVFYAGINYTRDRI